MSWLKDFKRVTVAQEKKHFTFFPEELITNPDEFVQALFQYAREQGKEIVITKESMSPNFTLNGIEYNATRLTSICGSYVVVNVIHPEELDVKDIPKERCRPMEIVWKYIIPTCFWLGVVSLFIIR